MRKHTPGPWRLALPPHDLRKVGERRCEVACIPHMAFDALDVFAADESYVNTYEEHVANARLIAAAPDLLEALREATLALDCVAKGEGVFKPIEQTIKVGLAAISKAEGGTP